MDKMFIRVYNHRNNDGKLEKVEYDYSTDENGNFIHGPQHQTREQRENALLDIELGILRSKSVAEALFDPGTFDPIKKEARIGQILSETSDNGSSLLGIWQDEHGIDYNNIDEAYTSLNNADLDELVSFVNRFAEKKSLLSLDTFIYNHQQNMAGAALIGMYANNTTAQAKMQTTNLELKNFATFRLNGRTIKSLHDIYSEKNGIRERISKRCAYFSAASVDNVKDPCLRKIGQNINTAYIAGFMLRAGIDVQEISLLFGQPLIKENIDATGKIPGKKSVDNYIKNLCKRYQVSVNESEYLNYTTRDFTSLDLTKIIVRLNRTKYFRTQEIAEMPMEERKQLVLDAIQAVLLFKHIEDCAKQLKPSVQISRADSPNGAIEHELHTANLQVRAIDRYMAQQHSKGWAIENISDIMANGIVSVNDSKATLRKKLLDKDKVKVPRLQAFYSLGIELAQKLIARYFISQSPVCQAIVSNIESELPTGNLGEDSLKVLYNDFVTYMLTGTNLFGDSDEGTFEEKRDYYLYQFPQKFIKTLNDNPNLKTSPALANLRVVNGEIVMERSGRVTTTLRDTLTYGFDSLLFGKDDVASQLAFDLMRYSFYNDGFIFRHNSYGQFFSSAFLASFPEMLNKLRTRPNADMITNFTEQWASQKDNVGLFYQVPQSSGVVRLDDGSIALDKELIPYNEKTDSVYNYVSFENTLYGYKGFNAEQGAIYVPINSIDAGPTAGKLHKFNARKSAREISGETNTERVNNLRKLNSLSVRQIVAQSRNESQKVPDITTLDGADIPDVNMPNFDNIPEDVNNINELDNAHTLDVDIDFPEGFDEAMATLEEANVNLSKLEDGADFSIEDGQQTLINLGEDPLCPPQL